MLVGCYVEIRIRRDIFDLEFISLGGVGGIYRVLMESRGCCGLSRGWIVLGEGTGGSLDSREESTVLKELCGIVPGLDIKRAEA